MIPSSWKLIGYLRVLRCDWVTFVQDQFVSSQIQIYYKRQEHDVLKLTITASQLEEKKTATYSEDNGGSDNEGGIYRKTDGQYVIVWFNPQNQVYVYVESLESSIDIEELLKIAKSIGQL